MIIPEDKIEEIRAAANVVDVVSDYVQLKKRGKNYVGLCPFHSEKTPSFTVSEEKQIFHCFGCHLGGNVFKFIMEYEKISFVESVQQLAEKFGISLETVEPGDGKKQSEQEELYDINTETAKYFSDNLLKSDAGEIARKYFENRNIKQKTMRAFGLGYALPGWENFVNWARDKHIDFDKALKLGLIGKSSDGRLYDKLSGRIIFPIFSPNGRVVAFAGRILQEERETAKYLNSPESSIYHKSRVLYGLSHGKDVIRKNDVVLVVEGYMDVLALHQHGIKNVVAVSGTSLTDEQVQLLSRYTKNVVLFFDADTAGIKAAMRSIEILLKKNIEIKVATMPEGEDPDSFVNKYGKEEFEELIDRAENFLEYQTAYYEKEGKFEEPSKTAEAIRELVKPLALINDELKRNLLMQSIAKRFNLREKLIESELEKVMKGEKRKSENEQRIKERAKERKEPEIAGAKEKNISSAEYRLEKEIIKLLFEDEVKVVELIVKYIQPEEYEFEIHKKIADVVYEFYHNDENIIAGSVIDHFEDESIASYIHELSIDNYSISKNWDEYDSESIRENQLIKFTLDSIKKYKLSKIEKEIIDNHNKIEDAETEEKKMEIMKQNKELLKEKNQIKDELSRVEAGKTI